MAAPKLSGKDALALQKHKVDRRYDLAARLGSLLIARGFKWGFFAILAYQGQIAITALAGKTTLSGLIVSIGSNVAVGVTASWTVTIGFGAWVFFERRLRKSTVERLTLRLRKYEEQLDPGRTSSQLTTKGDTPREAEA